MQFLLLACGISWGLLCSNPAAVWWSLNWTVLLFIMSSSKHFPWDGIKGRCQQLTEITVLPGRSRQTTCSSHEQYTAENNMHILLTYIGGFSDIIRNYIVVCDTLLQRVISLMVSWSIWGPKCSQPYGANKANIETFIRIVSKNFGDLGWAREYKDCLNNTEAPRLSKIDV